MSTDPSYTVFIRLPFPRGDFVDPPFVDWDASKDKALWKILSKASKNSDIDWSELATKFEVTLAFLLQQAAWLYERQLLQVRAQMRKVGASKSTAPSPIPGSTYETGGESMRRTGSGGGRLPSSLSTRRASPISKAESSIPGTPGRVAPPISRTSSTNTATSARLLSQAAQTSPRPGNAHLHKASASKPPLLPPQRSSQADPMSSPSESSEDSSEESTSQSPFVRRPPKFHSNKMGRSEDADDDEGDEPAFMPFTGETHHDPSATLRGDPRGMTSRRTPTHKKAEVSQTSDSSASSTAPPTRRVELGNKRLGPLSPRRTAELVGRSPGKGRESEGSPSMGSSFSDLDDTSITQSALEEALASNMQAGGGMASRMSTISQALRSKYL